jgi:hypothetical protein
MRGKQIKIHRLLDITEAVMDLQQDLILVVGVVVIPVAWSMHYLQHLHIHGWLLPAAVVVVA